GMPSRDGTTAAGDATSTFFGTASARPVVDPHAKPRAAGTRARATPRAPLPRRTRERRPPAPGRLAEHPSPARDSSRHPRDRVRGRARARLWRALVDRAYLTLRARSFCPFERYTLAITLPDASRSKIVRASGLSVLSKNVVAFSGNSSTFG